MRTLALLVSATVMLGACARPPASPPAPAEGDGRHLRNVKQLTDDGDNGEAYFSRDGKKLIFQSSRGGYACDKIWTMNADGSDKRMVSPDHGANTCSFFLPDGRIIYSSTSHLPGDCPPRPQSPPGVRYVWPLYPYDIYIANADGSDPKRITDNPKYDAEPVVSADGKRIVFGSQRAGDFDIYSMNVDGTDARRLTDTVGYDGGPWWSPDGSKIAWRAWYPATDEERARWKDAMEHDYIIAVPLDLWVMDADGSNKRLLLRNGATNWAPSWHPDGRRIIFSSNKDDWREDIRQYGHNFELYLINLDGTGLERLTFNRTFDSFPMFSPDGRKLAWGSNRTPSKPRQTDIYIADWAE